jgi:hypothetical protein
MTSLRRASGIRLNGYLDWRLFALAILLTMVALSAIMLLIDLVSYLIDLQLPPLGA